MCSRKMEPEESCSNHSGTVYLSEPQNLDALRFPLSSSTRIRFTCLSVSHHALALGTNTGAVHLFNRDDLQYQEAVAVTKASSAVERVALLPFGKLLAVADSTGLVNVIQIRLSKQHKSKKTRSHDQHKGNKVTSMVWKPDGTKLFMGSDKGLVTAMNFHSSKVKGLVQMNSIVLMQLDSPINQIDCWQDKLVISTLTKSYICNTEKEQYSQVGKKARDGRYGNCFIQEQATTDSAFIYCARPGSRLWQVQHNGTVLNTLMFKHLLDIPPAKVIKQLDDFTSSKQSPGSQSVAFLKLIPHKEYIVTWSDKGLYIINPGQGKLVLWTDITEINDIHCEDDDVYILTKQNNVRKLKLMSSAQLLVQMFKQYNLPMCAKIFKLHAEELKDEKSIDILSMELMQCLERHFEDDTNALIQINEIQTKIQIMTLEKERESSEMSGYEVTDGGIYKVKPASQKVDDTLGFTSKNLPLNLSNLGESRSNSDDAVSISSGSTIESFDQQFSGPLYSNVETYSVGSADSGKGDTSSADAVSRTSFNMEGNTEGENPVETAEATKVSESIKDACIEETGTDETQKSSRHELLFNNIPNVKGRNTNGLYKGFQATNIPENIANDKKSSFISEKLNIDMASSEPIVAKSNRKTKIKKLPRTFSVEACMTDKKKETVERSNSMPLIQETKALDSGSNVISHETLDRKTSQFQLGSDETDSGVINSVESDHNMVLLGGLDTCADDDKHGKIETILPSARDNSNVSQESDFVIKDNMMKSETNIENEKDTSPHGAISEHSTDNKQTEKAARFSAVTQKLASKLEEKAVEMKAKVTVKAKSVIQSIKEKREGSDSISILDSPFHHDGLSGTEFSRTREDESFVDRNHLTLQGLSISTENSRLMLQDTTSETSHKELLTTWLNEFHKALFSSIAEDQRRVIPVCLQCLFHKVNKRDTGNNENTPQQDILEEVKSSPKDENDYKTKIMNKMESSNVQDVTDLESFVNSDDPKKDQLDINDNHDQLNENIIVKCQFCKCHLHRNSQFWFISKQEPFNMSKTLQMEISYLITKCMHLKVVGRIGEYRDYIGTLLVNGNVKELVKEDDAKINANVEETDKCEWVLPVCEADKQLDMDMGLFLCVYWPFLDAKELHRVIREDLICRVYRWRAFVRCLQAFPSNCEAGKSIELGDMASAVSKIKSGKCSTVCLLSHLVSLYEANCDILLDLSSTLTTQQLHPLDMCLVSLYEQEGSTQLFRKYLEKATEEKSLMERSLLIDCCCEDDDLLLFTVKCLLQNSSYPGESSKACECGFPWPNTYIEVKAQTNSNNKDLVLMTLQNCKKKQNSKMTDKIKSLCVTFRFWQGVIEAERNITVRQNMIMQLGSCQLLQEEINLTSKANWHQILRKKESCQTKVESNEYGLKIHQQCLQCKNTLEATVSDQHYYWRSGITWENLGQLLIKYVGVKVATVMLKDVNVPQGALTAEFYRSCIAASINDRLQMHLSAGKGSQKRHWGKTVNILRKCAVCNKCLTDEPGGVIIFICGHGMHQMCAPTSKCLICSSEDQ